MRNIVNFADWMKIDLHIHTNKSRETKENDYKGIFSVDILKSKLKEQNVSIFSLTDHNIINTDAYKEYLKNYTDEDPFPLIGFEADIKYGENTYHALVIFAENIVEKNEQIDILASRVEELYKGMNKKDRNITFENLIKQFNANEFLFIVHSGNHKSIIDAYKNLDIKDAQLKILVYENIGVEQGIESKIQKFNKGFQKYLKNYIKAETQVPYLDFSDNHYIEKYPCIGKDVTRQHNFYYIKGIKNYESIRLAFIDPIVRIKPESQINDLKKNLDKRCYIKNLVINGTNLQDGERIKDCELEFSPHFNVIIGGRSSGKSLLLDIIGKKISSLEFDSENKYNFDSKNQFIKSSKDANYVGQTSIESSKLIYLKQNKIIEFFLNKNLNDLAYKLNKKEEYDNLKNSFTQKKSQIEDLINTIKKVYNDEIKELIKEKYIIYEKDINNLNLTGWKFNNTCKIENKIPFDKKQELLMSLKNSLNSFISDTFWKLKDNEKDIVNQVIKLIGIKESYLNKKRINVSKKELFIKNIEKIVTLVNNSISTEAAKKDDAEKNINKIINNISNRFTNFNKLKNLLKLFEECQLYHSEYINLNNDIILTKETYYPEDIKDKNLSNYILNQIFETPNNNLFLTLISNSPIKRKQTFEKKLEKIMNEIYDSFKNTKDFLTYEDKTTSKNKSPGLNSEKYLSSILSNDNIQIIIIDQPEDNLGTTFITGSENSLVNMIRNNKFKKQIFFVTHNASIAVYGDAESIIYSENNNNEISYKQILIEDIASKDIICKNLDGGYTVFNNRSKKYNIKKINGE